MSSTSDPSFQKILTGRHAVHDFDPTVKIDRQELTQMITEATLAPSALNVQPWRIVVIESPAMKAKIKPLMPNDVHQNETASALIVFFADLQAADNAQFIFDQTKAAGLLPAGVDERYVTMIQTIYQRMSAADLRNTFTLDTALPAMQFMLVARAHGFETGPMTGFNHEKIGSALGMAPERYVPIIMLAVGKAASAPTKSVRLPMTKILIFR